MTLYILQGRGIFSDAAEETLPATVFVVGGGKDCKVSLDGEQLRVTGDHIVLPEGLKNGAHGLKVNGRACEGILVRQGRVRPAGEDFRRLLPALYRTYSIEERLRVLEAKAKEKEVDWLK